MTISEQKSEKIRGLLQKIEDTTKLEGCAVITRDGVRLASSASTSVDADMLSAASAAMISTGEMAAMQLSYGSLSDIIIRGDNGHILLTRAGPNHMLVAASKDTTQLGLNLGVLRRYASQISGMIGVTPEVPAAPRIPVTTPMPTPPPKPVTVTTAVPAPRPPTTPKITTTVEPQAPIPQAPAQEIPDEISGDEKGAIFEALRALGLEDMIKIPSTKEGKKPEAERI
ncbi:MAG: roadblock/LC7 domain-containing protein [Candidatus Jordarchaeum sp.]|uniref:roadblock/LC7 domain-containing protein n=1 Tax=Candidatus Jordarchaeum sp. TaxID=2823881 RepID=UPI00404B4E2C